MRIKRLRGRKLLVWLFMLCLSFFCLLFFLRFLFFLGLWNYPNNLIYYTTLLTLVKAFFFLDIFKRIKILPSLFLFAYTRFYAFCVCEIFSLKKVLNYPNNLIYITAGNTLLNFACKKLVTSCLLCLVLLFKQTV